MSDPIDTFAFDDSGNMANPEKFDWNGDIDVHATELGEIEVQPVIGSTYEVTASQRVRTTMSTLTTNGTLLTAAVDAKVTLTTDKTNPAPWSAGQAQAPIIDVSKGIPGLRFHKYPRDLLTDDGEPAKPGQVAQMMTQHIGNSENWRQSLLNQIPALTAEVIQDRLEKREDHTNSALADEMDNEPADEAPALDMEQAVDAPFGEQSNQDEPEFDETSLDNAPAEATEIILETPEPGEPDDMLLETPEPDAVTESEENRFTSTLASLTGESGEPGEPESSSLQDATGDQSEWSTDDDDLDALSFSNDLDAEVEEMARTLSSTNLEDEAQLPATNLESSHEGAMSSEADTAAENQPANNEMTQADTPETVADPVSENQEQGNAEEFSVLTIQTDQGPDLEFRGRKLCDLSGESENVASAALYQTLKGTFIVHHATGQAEIIDKENSSELFEIFGYGPEAKAAYRAAGVRCTRWVE